MKTIKNNQQGFTLIELLAIIVILAVIMAIAIPQVLNVVNGSKDSAWKDNVKMISKAIELNTQMLDPETGGYTYTVESLCKNPNNVNKISKSTDTKVTCSSNVFTINGTGQFDGKTATIDCRNGSCSTTFAEGVNQPSTIASCPGCRFMYTMNKYYYGEDADTLTVNDTKANYNDVITSDRQYFLGVILSDGDHGTIERAFVCGVEKETPFCIEGTRDGSKNTDNMAILNSLYGPYNESTKLGCVEDPFDSDMQCTGSTVDTSIYYNILRVDWCEVHMNGELGCGFK